MDSEPLNMENSVLDYDFGLENDTMDTFDMEHPLDEDEMFESSVNGELYIPLGETNLEPYIGMEFESEEAARSFYTTYGCRVGFSTRVSMFRRSRRDGKIIQRSFVCAKEGNRVEKENSGFDRKIKRPWDVTRVGCRAMMVLKVQGSGKWVVTAFEKDHNHELLLPDKVHVLRPHRHVSGSEKALIDTLQAAGMGMSGIMSVLIKEYGGIREVGFSERDCRNYMKSSKQKTLGGDTQLLLDYLRRMHVENPAFFYAVLGEVDDCMSNIFWADQKARMSYTYFGDTVTFYASYRSKGYRLPFAAFTGVNHHGKPVLFGCAFLLNESEESFIWLFKTWLSAMSGRVPISITTHHDKVIRTSITHVLPETRQRFCKWHIFKDCQEKLIHHLQIPRFEAEFHKCVDLTESAEEFESCWASLIDTYGLKENEWLCAVYDARRQWVPVYLRDTFFAEMSITQQSDSMNSYFDGYVDASTPLQMFVKQYEMALESRYEEEVKADFETMSTAPVFKTPSPMERQAADLYTKKLFMKFQEELIETLTFMAKKVNDDEVISIYRVAKHGDDHRAYIVQLNHMEMKATCSCQMFEFSGLLCRHVLTVFRVINVLTLPSQYILKRWTRNAKSGVVLKERSGNLLNTYCESQTERYNSLRHEALKYVDEGAKNVDIYHVAMGSLQNALKKVSLAKQNGGKLPPMLKIGSEEDGVADGTCSSDGHQWTLCHPQYADDKDRVIHELSQNLDGAKRKCEVYRANLLSILKDVEEQKLKLSVKVQNIKLGMKD